MTWIVVGIVVLLVLLELWHLRRGRSEQPMTRADWTRLDSLPVYADGAPRPQPALDQRWSKTQPVNRAALRRALKFASKRTRTAPKKARQLQLVPVAEHQRREA